MQKHSEGQQARVVAAALKALGIDNFLLGIQDAAFPALPEEDTGCGSPYSDGAAGFLEFVRALGFNGLQLGPQGITARADASPYDGTLFPRNPLSLAPLRLSRLPGNLLPPGEITALVNRGPIGTARVDVASAARYIRTITDLVRGRFRRLGGLQKGPVEPRLVRPYLASRRRNAAWLERDGLYEILKAGYGGKNWQEWDGGAQARLDRTLFAPPAGTGQAAQKRIGELSGPHRAALEDYCFIQYLLAGQHDELRSLCENLGLKLFGDCQIGLSDRDAWYAQGFLLDDYLMGAPPSPTNPEGQPWNYPVFDPRRDPAARPGSPFSAGGAGRQALYRIRRAANRSSPWSDLSLGLPRR
ncbi:MAG: 4-alpha-glucanotransferase [Desulfobulbales bacterium]|nr:4-alpha-glucanotransferase [Desulfobulbales bacterium]